MPAASSFSDAEWTQQLAAERARREQAEAELAQLRARLAGLEQPADAPFQALHTQLGALVHNLRLGIVLVDGGGQIQYVSPHFWRLFGLEPVAGPPFTHAQLSISPAFADPDDFATRAWPCTQPVKPCSAKNFCCAMAAGWCSTTWYLTKPGRAASSATAT